MASNSTGPLLVGGIPIVWLVVLSCSLIVIGVCALSYPLILLNRWRMREGKIKSESDQGDDDDDDEEEAERRPKRGIFGRGRPSTRGKWVERMDPQSGQPYYEHTGTGEVTWTDPRPQKMRNQEKRQGNGNLVVASMMQPSMGPNGSLPAYGAPGGFGGPRPGFPQQGSMGMGPPMNAGLPHSSSMGNVLPPQMQGPPRMAPAGQPFNGMPPGMPPGGMPPGVNQGNAPPGMMSAGSMRRTQAPQGVPNQAPPAAAPIPAAPAADPKFDKYSRMQKAGLPEGAIRNAMARDGLSDAEQKTFFGS